MTTNLTHVIAGALAAAVQAPDPYQARLQRAKNVLRTLQTVGVLAPSLVDVWEERRRQDAKWGEQNHPDGTGPEAEPLSIAPWCHTTTEIDPNDSARRLAEIFTQRTDDRFSSSTTDRPGTWADILLEEVFEGLAEEDPARLRVELIQVAAVATQWAEAIDRRAKEADQ